MGRIRDGAFDSASRVIRRTVVFGIDTAINLAGIVVFSFLPEGAYELVSVETYCRTKTGAATLQVKVGGRTATLATGAFTAATVVAAALAAAAADYQGSATERITGELTTDGTGALTNGAVTITYRLRIARQD